MFSLSSLLLILISIILLIIPDHNAIFSSLIRNNLNRYLKNPLFTRSFVRNSQWQGEFDGEHGGSAISPLLASHPSDIQLNEFVKSQNILDTYGSYNFAETIPSNPMIAKSAPPPSHLPPPVLDDSQMKYLNNKIDMENNQDFLGGTIKSSPTLKTSNTINAYSDSKRIHSSFNGKNQSNSSNNHPNQKPNQSNLYVNDIDNDSHSNQQTLNRIHFPNHHQQQSKNHSNQHKKLKGNHKKTLSNGWQKINNKSKYNQEKALNLKLEYGFKPLPPIRKDNFLNSNSIQKSNEPSSPADDSISNNNNDVDANELDKKDPINDSSLYSFLYNRTMKSMMDTSSNNNHLEDFTSHDYKKYISYPMETESSDVHKLAFTGVESFRPDHGYFGMGSEQNYRHWDTIANYPNIKNFKKQGVDCARSHSTSSSASAYCEYDSSYPIDYINSIITNCTSIIDDMYIEMPENLKDFSGYKSFFHIYHDSNNFNDDNGKQAKNNISLCESERKYIRPSVIKDIHDEYHLILQSSFYFQQIPVEICLKPGSTCNYIGRCNAQVKCRQKYRTHLLISIVHQESNLDYYSDNNGKPNCPKMRMYRLPSACVCELSTTIDQ